MSKKVKNMDLDDFETRNPPGPNYWRPTSTSDQNYI